MGRRLAAVRSAPTSRARAFRIAAPSKRNMDYLHYCVKSYSVRGRDMSTVFSAFSELFQLLRSSNATCGVALLLNGSTQETRSVEFQSCTTSICRDGNVSKLKTLREVSFFFACRGSLILSRPFSIFLAAAFGIFARLITL